MCEIDIGKKVEKFLVDTKLPFPYIRLGKRKFLPVLEKTIISEAIAKRSVMPECFYRASMISSSYQIDSRP
ncbi:MAG: hypothetical protein CO171_03950, partial [Syntrophobacterales bacterium CG_4_9_14_3_um_filter_49_8]